MTEFKLDIDISKLKEIKNRNPEKVGAWLRGVALQMVGDIKLSFGTSPDGRTYKRTDKKGNTVTHIASQPGYPPNVDLGTLRASIDSRKVNNYTQEIYSEVEYALGLELGLEGKAARPFVGPVFSDWSKKIAKDAKDNLGID